MWIAQEILPYNKTKNIKNLTKDLKLKKQVKIN